MSLLTDDIVKHDALDQAVATLREHLGGIALEGDVSVERVLLAKALVLQLALWPDHEVAESVDIDLGMPVLRKLEIGESVLLTAKQPADLEEQLEEIQFEIKRLPGVTPPRKILACHGNVWNGRPTCCATLGKP